MSPVIKLLRPSHWLKNVFVFMPLFFSGALLSRELLALSVMAFAMFCMVSSAVYCINDVMDREADRNHPKKRLRPVASGAVSPSLAITIAVMLVVIATAIPFFIYPAPSRALLLMAVVWSYMLMNVAYSLWLKHMAIIDIMIIALGFVLRIVAGGIACAIYLSSWIIIMTFLVTLLIAMSKRRSDFMIQERAGNPQRESVKNYSPLFMNVGIGILAAMSIFGYIMYSLSPSGIACSSEYFYCSSIFVIGGILRYLMLVFARGEGDEPVAMLTHDRGLQLCVICWFICVSIMIYI